MIRKPLYVDLDGTLIKSDLLHESLLGLLKSNPLAVFLVPMWLRRGRANLKQVIAQRVEIDAASLPYSESFLEYLKEESASGRTLVLATASDQKYAKQVSSRIGPERRARGPSRQRVAYLLHILSWSREQKGRYSPIVCVVWALA